MKSDRQVVLLVDDEIEILGVVGELLGAYGFTTILAPNGQTALDRLESNKEIDIVVSDLRMPNMSGVELLAELRARGHNQPVIFMTGHGGSDEWPGIEKRFRYEDHSGMIRKPFDTLELLELITTATEPKKGKSKRE